jgi:hypothetical protein
MKGDTGTFLGPSEDGWLLTAPDAFAGTVCPVWPSMIERAPADAASATAALVAHSDADALDALTRALDR